MSIGKHTTKDVSENDFGWITQSLRRLRVFLETKSGQVFSDVPDPKTLDTYFLVALEEMRAGNMTQDEVVDTFGCGFGQYMVEKHGFEWKIFTDEYGTDLAVEKNGGFGFPLSSTTKRLKDETAGTFDAIALMLTQQ